MTPIEKKLMKFTYSKMLILATIIISNQALSKSMTEEEIDDFIQTLNKNQLEFLTDWTQYSSTCLGEFVLASQMSEELFETTAKTCTAVGAGILFQEWRSNDSEELTKDEYIIDSAWLTSNHEKLAAASTNLLFDVTKKYVDENRKKKF